MFLTDSATTPSGMGQSVVNNDVRSLDKYTLRTRAAILVIGCLLSWGVIFLFAWSVF